MTKASIVIPSRGGAARLPVLLSALAAQTHPDWEAIVVIDGDIDGSAAVVERFAHLPVRAIVLPENKGRVTALNTGFAAASGDVLIRADDDFEPSPGHVAAHVAAHADTECGAIGLPLNIAEDNAYMRAYGYDADRRGREAAYAAAPDDRWRHWGGNTSVSRTVYNRVGGFDDRYQGYGWEDVDFGYRVHALGYPIVMVPDAEVRHHMASIDTRTRAERAYASGLARGRFEQIHSAVTSTAEPNSVWERVTRRVAEHLDAESTSATAGFVDRVLPAMPKPVGRKAVALVVESAARAGSNAGRAT